LAAVFLIPLGLATLSFFVSFLAASNAAKGGGEGGVSRHWRPEDIGAKDDKFLDKKVRFPFAPCEFSLLVCVVWLRLCAAVLTGLCPTVLRMRCWCLRVCVCACRSS